MGQLAGRWLLQLSPVLIAKENIVGTMGILYGGGDGTVYQALAGAFTTASGFSFLVFNLLCAPCSQLWVLSRER